MLAFAVCAAIVIVVGRAVPLEPRRRAIVIALRVAVLACLLLALRGVTWTTRQEVPRQIVYLVDQSASIDPGQTQWMARRIASLEAIRPPRLERAVLAFGGQAHEVIRMGREPLTDARRIEALLTEAPVERAATNLEAALLASFAPSTRTPDASASPEALRVILLTDGRQTRGSVERILDYARRFGLEVFPVPVDPTQPQGVLWEQLAVPPLVHQGASVPMRLAFHNATGRPQPVEVTVSLHGVPVAHRRQTIAAGWQVVTIPAPVLGTGSLQYDVTVAMPGGVTQQRKAYVEVEGPPKVLFVLDRPTELPLLAAALKRREIQIAVTTPVELATDPNALLDHDAVVLFNVPKSVFQPAQVDALRAYIERSGGGLVMVGLGGVLRDELVRTAPLDALLPVRFEPKGIQEANRRLCMIMLIDRSASMLGPRIAATKRAAIELVKQLAPEDLVGIYAFDTTPYVIAELQPAAQVGQTLIDKLVRLKATGGTDIYPALKIAQQRLEASGADVKHVILLSDGQTPFELKAYRQLMIDFNQEKISVSTIGVGSIMINTDYLNWLSSGTGGSAYYLNGLDELPKIVARDTQQAVGKLPFTEGSFRPRAPAGAEWFPDIKEWPTVKGYLTTTAKPGARVELELPRNDAGDPLLAHWPLGLGRVTVFASDAQARWCPEWIRWPRFENVWAEIVRQTMRPPPAESLFAWFDQHAGTASVVIEGELTEPSAELLPAAGGGAAIPLGLVQQGQFRWAASVSHLENGWYQLIVKSRQGQATALTRRWIQIGRPDTPTEQRNLPPDQVLLRRIAHATGGVMATPDRAFVPPTEWATTARPLRQWLVPLAMVLLLVEIALRGRTML